MIRIVREPLPEAVTAEMVKYTAEISASAERQKHAQGLWKHSTVRRRVRSQLDEALRRMAPGREYCMYCGDNRGTDIDHFEPVARNPLRTFDWLNHLLACSGCNSHQKRGRFPLDAAGRPLLIDPTAEDPFEHLMLTFTLGEYDALTDKGQATIEICDLNNELLARGRADAVYHLQTMLRDWARADLRADHAAKNTLVRRVQDQPLADVCQSMLRQAHNVNADLIFEPDIVNILRRPDLQKALLR
ncbi:HNH endonuclease [Actinocorallia lasiicapitis]